MLNRIKKLSRWQLFMFVFFLVIFLIGIFTVKDYGLSDDERIERNHSLVIHYYLRSVLEGKFNADGLPIEDINKSNLEKLIEKENVERRIFKYEYKYYGVAMHIPLTLIEQIFDYDLDVQIIYYIRHFFTFLIFFTSLIYFYKLLKKYILKNEKLAFVATLFLLLSPRIYGDAFYNIKDLVFMSLVIINLYYSFKYLENANNKNLVLLCFISALTINCRIIGGFVIFLTLIFKMVKISKNKLDMIKTCLKLFLLTYIFYILVTPTSWNNPIKFPIEAINFFFNFIDPNSHKLQKCFYFGSWISSESLPWHYLPVWIFITTPLIYIVFSLIGFFKEIISNIKNKFKNIDQEWLFCNIILVVMLLFVIIFRPILYTGWRHFYFIYPIIIINAILGLKWLLNITNKYNKVIIVIVLINLIYITSWMIKNHPYQYEYFNLVTRDYSVENFETNYWKISNSDALKYIADHTKTRVRVYLKIKVNYKLLNKNDRSKIKLVKSVKDADYIIDNDKYGNKKYQEKYEEITFKEIDGYRLYTIYKK